MLLEQQERQLCEHLTAAQPPYSQRALSLLALDDGATQTAAAQQSGQSAGQVRYWLGKFRKNRMGIFPEELLSQSGPDLLPSQGSSDQPTEPEVLDLDQPGKQEMAREKSKGVAEVGAAEADLVKKGKVKTKKKSKKDNAPKKATKKTKKKKSKSGKKRKEKKSKKAKKTRGKKGKKSKKK